MNVERATEESHLGSSSFLMAIELLFSRRLKRDGLEMADVLAIFRWPPQRGPPFGSPFDLPKQPCCPRDLRFVEQVSQNRNGCGPSHPGIRRGARQARRGGQGRA